MSHIDMLGEA